MIVVLLLPVLPLHAETNDVKPIISIIIDDMGDRQFLDERVIDLPGKVTCAFLPHATFTSRYAHKAHAHGKEVMLHMPMQPENNEKMPPFGLSLDMNKDQFITQLQAAINAVPHVRGINNHMGSLLTQFPGHMSWFMQTLKDNKSLYFVDSRTTTKTVAAFIANEYNIPVVERDIFLDASQDKNEILRQFKLLLHNARLTGSAIAIGHPYPETLEVLEKEIPKLDSLNIKLVPITSTIRHRVTRRQAWQTYSSPSRKVVKN